MSKTPFMPLWVSDFLGDTLDLEAAEIGAYMLLLMAQWNRDGESLPDDDAKLRRVARCGRNWPKVWGAIERYFTRDETGVYSKRLRLEAQNVAAKREVNAHNGARGGRAKALKTNKPTLANATHSLQRNPSIPEPEPNIREEDTNVSSVVSLPDIMSECIAHFNETAERVGWPKIQKFTKPRRAALSQRIADVGGVDAWRDAITRAAASPLLTGQTGGGWSADFDWLVKAANFTKLMEGNYDNRIGSKQSPAGSGAARSGPADALIHGFAASTVHY